MSPSQRPSRNTPEVRQSRCCFLLWDVSERGRQEGLVLRAGPMLAGLQGDSGEWTGNYQNLGKFCNYINFDFVVRRKEAGLELPLNKLSFLLAVEGISWPFWQLHGIYFYPCLGIITEWSFSFCFFCFFFFFVVNFVIHWNETATGLHVFPIPIPPPTSLSTRSL